MSENIIKDKSYDFALAVISICKKLTEEKREFVLSKQLLRSGTSLSEKCEELCRILSKIQLTLKSRIKNL